MNRTKVNSSRILSIGWSNNILEIEFHNGAIYQYYNVKEYEYKAFMCSASLGSALSELDKTHKYLRIK